MTIDERLDRLTERHEALTSHVELITAEIAQLAAENRAFHADVARMRSTMDDLMVGFSTLVELVRNHERRIERLGNN